MTACAQYPAGHERALEVLFNYALTPAQIRTLYNQDAAVWFGPVTGTP
jgi:hypothetical protein